MFKKLKNFILQNDKVIHILLILIGFLISFKEINSPLLFGDMDGYARANIAFDLYQKNKLFNLNYKGGIWLPLYQNILGFSISLSKDPQLGPRLISLIFSVISIPLIFNLTKKIFIKNKKSRIIALIAAIIYLLHPLRLMLDTQPLSETGSMLFFLLILNELFREKPRILILVIISNIACLIRFEFWFLIPIIWLFIYLDKNKKNITFKYLVFLIAPIFIMFLNQKFLGNFFAFFTNKYSIAHNDYNRKITYYNFFLANKYWIDAILDQLGISSLILLAYSLEKILKNKTFNKKTLIFILIPIYFFVSLVIQAYLGTMEWIAPRYLFPVIITLIPLISYGIVSLAELAYKYRKDILILQITAVALTLCFVDVYGLIKNARNWQQTISYPEKLQILDLVEYYRKDIEMNRARIAYVSNGDWLHPMFVYLTQRHDLILTNYLNSEVARKNDINYVIFAKKQRTINSCNKIKFENDSFIVCKM